jgi:hypothetical protein
MSRFKAYKYNYRRKLDINQLYFDFSRCVPSYNNLKKKLKIYKHKNSYNHKWDYCNVPERNLFIAIIEQGISDVIFLNKELFKNDKDKELFYFLCEISGIEPDDIFIFIRKIKEYKQKNKINHLRFFNIFKSYIVKILTY